MIGVEWYIILSYLILCTHAIIIKIHKESPSQQFWLLSYLCMCVMEEWVYVLRWREPVRFYLPRGWGQFANRHSPFTEAAQFKMWESKEESSSLCTDCVQQGIVCQQILTLGIEKRLLWRYNTSSKPWGLSNICKLTHNIGVNERVPVGRVNEVGLSHEGTEGLVLPWLTIQAGWRRMWNQMGI